MKRSQIKIFKNDAAIKIANEIRIQVFGIEQNIPVAFEVDPLDKEAFHAIAYYEGKAVGTARLVIEKQNTADLGRVAVLAEYRGLGIANQLTRAICFKAKQLKIKRINLLCRKYLLELYRNNGFSYVGEGEFIYGYQLIVMTKEIK